MTQTIQIYEARKRKVNLDNSSPEMDLDSKLKRVILAYLDTEKLLIELGKQPLHTQAKLFIDSETFPFSSRGILVGSKINHAADNSLISERIMVAYGNALGTIYDDLMERDEIELIEGTQAYHYLAGLGVKIDSNNKTSFRDLNMDVRIKLVPCLLEQHSHAYKLAFGEKFDFSQKEKATVSMPEFLCLSKKEREEIERIVEQREGLDLSDFYSRFGSYIKEEVSWVYDKLFRDKHRWETVPHTSKDSLEDLDDLLQASLGDKEAESKLKRVFLWYDSDVEVAYYEPDRVANYDSSPPRNVSETLISEGTTHENTETAKILVRRIVKQITTELFQRESIRAHLEDVHSGNSEHYVDEVILQQALQNDGAGSYQDTIRYLKYFKSLIEDVFGLTMTHGDPYKVLHLEPTKELTEEKVNQAYRQRLVELHPDKNGGDGEEFKDQFEKLKGAKNTLFKIISEGKVSNNSHVSELRKYVGRPSYFVKDMKMGVSNG